MARAQIAILPMRHNGRAWVPCETHRAQQWAVAFLQGGRIRKVLGRYATKAQAESVGASEARRALGLSRPYSLGARLPARPEPEASLHLDDLYIRSL